MVLALVFNCILMLILILTLILILVMILIPIWSVCNFVLYLVISTLIWIRIWIGLDSDSYRCSASDDSDDDINRNAEDKETEIMEDLAMAQAMEPKNDVSLP